MLRGVFGFFLENIYDTMVAEMILMCGLQRRGFSLERLSKKYLGFSYASSNQLDLFAAPTDIHLTKATRQSFRHVGDKAFTKEQIIYGLKDIEHTIKIYNHQLEALTERDLLSTCWVEFMTTVALAEMEYFGFYLDAEAWTQLAKKHELKQQEALKAVLACITNEPLPEKFYEFQRSLFERTDTAEKGISINLSSSRQVIELCKALGIPTKTKDLVKSRELGEDIFKDSVEEKILKEHVDVHPVVDLYLTYKGFEKATTTYGIRFLQEHRHPITGACHTNYWQILNTGRLASQRPNLQQIPSEGKLSGFRNCFTPRSENRVLVTADYSSQEIRILADKTGDTPMLDFLNSDDPDFHSFTARRMFKLDLDKPVPKNLRTVAKILAFGISYGMSEHKLAKDFKISIEEAKEFIDNFYKSYPALEPYFKRAHRFSFDNGYILIDRFTRRKSYLPDWEEFKATERLVALSRVSGVKADGINWKRFYVVKGKIERASQNYGIQGQAASMTKLAMVLFRHYSKLENLDAYLVACVHDELVVESDIANSEKAGELLRKAMLYAGILLCPRVVMDSEQKISRTWEH